MKTLYSSRVKPNPPGKDRSRGAVMSATQLAAEWLDITNIGAQSVDLAGVELYHLAFRPGESQGHWAKIMDFSGNLPPGMTMRVHAGQCRDLSIIRPEDAAGADFHLFTGSDQYVWNNAEGDSPSLWEPASKQWIDQANYAPYPPEGTVLVRHGNQFLSSQSSARSHAASRGH